MKQPNQSQQKVVPNLPGHPVLHNVLFFFQVLLEELYRWNWQFPFLQHIIEFRKKAVGCCFPDTDCSVPLPALLPLLHRKVEYNSALQRSAKNFPCEDEGLASADEKLSKSILFHGVCQSRQSRAKGHYPLINVAAAVTTPLE